MPTTVQKSFTPNSKDVRYLNRDFTQLKSSLMDFAKTYFPNSYNDFSPASPGTMFIEMAAYVGDVLGYYTDYAFKESLLQNATERRNILNLARYLGYKVKPIQGAMGELELFQLCPSKVDDNGSYVPDPDYALMIKENMQVSNNVGAYFVVNDSVDFSVSTSLSPRRDTVYSRNPDGTPEFFLMGKTGKISSGRMVTKTVPVGSPTQFFKISLDETDVLGIVDIVDSNNNEWHEVDYLAQELVPVAVPNDAEHEGDLAGYKDSVPYILRYLKTSNRFITTVDQDNITSIEFGAGLEGFQDEFVTFDSRLIGVGLQNISNYNVPLDPSNFLKNESYGVSPSNTTLTIRYLVGGGIESNSPTNSIRNIVSVEFSNPTDGLPPEKIDLLTTVKNSLQVNNPTAAVGGKDGETDEEIKMNAVANFATQNRAVTRDDYLVRVYSMPPKFGSIAKAQIVTDSNLDVGTNRVLSGVVNSSNEGSIVNLGIGQYFRKVSFDISNPFSINVYLLSYNANKNLVPANQALLTNLMTYLKRYRIMTDGINVIDGYVINIGVDFTITVFKGYTKKDVLFNCIQSIQNFFNIDEWNFSQPINLSQLQLEIAKVEGVQAVVNLEISNKTILDGDYSAVEYDIASATKNGVIYSSVDPSIFEIKYPDSDIKGISL
jgi:hypothetical protein